MNHTRTSTPQGVIVRFHSDPVQVPPPVWQVGSLLLLGHRVRGVSRVTPILAVDALLAAKALAGPLSGGVSRVWIYNGERLTAKPKRRDNVPFYDTKEEPL